MKFIKPTPVNTAMLVSSTEAENDYAAWSSGSTYALGDKVISTSTHRIYESVQGSNTNHTLTDTAWWLDIGPTNRWAMFDSVVGTKTIGDAPLTVVIDTGIIDSVALLDLYATDVTVSMTDGAGGPTVYSQNFPLPDGAELLSWYDYFFADIEPTTTLIVSNLPPYGSARLTVTINADTTAECGTLVIGKRITCGQTLAQPTIGIQDWSRKEADQFGNYTVIERSFSKKIEARFWLESRKVDYVSKKLAEIRATPVIWLADDDEVFESLVAFGYFRDWGIDIVYPNYSEATITVEGLT